MESSNQSFVNEFNFSKEYTVLVLDVRRATVSLYFPVNNLQVLLKAGLIIVFNVCFESADEGPEKAPHDILTNLPKNFARHDHGLPKVAVVRFLSNAPFRLLSLMP